MLRIAKHEQLPQVSSRKAIREARNAHVNLATPYGPVHQRIDLGEGVSAEIQHPMAMLYAVSASSPAFAALLRRAVDRFPCSPVSPWKLIVYTDEVSPGNQLAYAHERKTWAWYWSFMEFEQSLSSEDFHTHAHTHTLTHTHTHTHTHIHIHMYVLCCTTFF